MQANSQSPASLLRALGPWTAVAVTAGSIIGSGVFKKPQAVAQSIPYFELAAVAWILGGILALLGALALAELGAMLPRAGGSYVYLKDGYSPIWGFLWGWVEFLILRTGSIAALATIFSESLASILRSTRPLAEWEETGLTIAVIAALAVVNVIGVRWGGLVQNLTTWLKVGSLAAIGLLPFLLGEANFTLITPFPTTPGSYVTQLQDAWTSGAAGTLLSTLGGLAVRFGAAVLGVMWAYHGWMNLSTLGEEVRDPQRNVPRALLIGVAIVMAVYLAANLAYAVVLPQQTMADDQQVKIVAVSFAEQVFTSWGPYAMDLAAKAVAAAIMISVFGALNANILIGPRTYFALGRDGLFPRFLGQVQPYFRTPALAIVTQAAWAIALVLGSAAIRKEGERAFDTLTNFVMLAAIIFETMVIASIFRFRALHPEWERPYRCWGYPWVPMIYVLVLAGMLVVTVIDQPLKAVVTGSIVAGGITAYGISRWLVNRSPPPSQLINH
jgi:amino acid transporter